MEGLILLIIIVFIIYKFMEPPEFNYQNVNIDSMDGHQFENFCAALLRDNGYVRVYVTKGSGDHGVDVIAYKDGQKYAIQCKRYTNNVGNKAVQEAYSGKGIYNADVAVVMTNRDFTKQAKEDAWKLGVRLWSRKDIMLMLRTAQKATASNNTGAKVETSSKPKSTISKEPVVKHSYQPERPTFSNPLGVNTNHNKNAEEKKSAEKINSNNNNLSSEKHDITFDFDKTSYKKIVKENLVSLAASETVKKGKPEDKAPEAFPDGVIPSDYMVRNIARHAGTTKPEMDIKNADEQEMVEFNKERGIQCVISNGSFEENEIKAVTGVDRSKPEPKKIKVKTDYKFPPISILGKDPNAETSQSKAQMLAMAQKLEDTLKSFGVDARVMQINQGPAFTRHELLLSQGVRVSRISNLADDIAFSLGVKNILVNTIPEKSAISIDVPNKNRGTVYIRTLFENRQFSKFPSKLALALGQDVAGNAVIVDISKMPHLLIAGTSSSEINMCINTIVTSVIYKSKPDEVKLLILDTKVIDLNVYNVLPHMIMPVITDTKKSVGTLNWAVREMLTRYNLFAENSVRDIKGYNAMKTEKGETDLMPQVVIIIDEIANLMDIFPADIEESVCRLTQLGATAGIHLIIASNKISSSVITDKIKRNIPTKIAFFMPTVNKSKILLDEVGAEKLLGKGDMLFYPTGMSKPVRIQGAFVTDKEVENIVDFLKEQNKETEYNQSMIEEISSAAKSGGGDGEHDEFFDEAVDLVVSKDKASVSMLQRQFRIGYNRAARLMDELEAAGVVGPEDGSKPRTVLIREYDVERYKRN